MHTRASNLNFNIKIKLPTTCSKQIKTNPFKNLQFLCANGAVL